MRKRYKIKKQSCGLCKPWKVGWMRRYKSKEEFLLRQFERLKSSLRSE